jgi:hypothetical protein
MFDVRGVCVAHGSVTFMVAGVQHCIGGNLGRMQSRWIIRSDVVSQPLMCIFTHRMLSHAHVLEERRYDGNGIGIPGGLGTESRTFRLRLSERKFLGSTSTTSASEGRFLLLSLVLLFLAVSTVIQYERQRQFVRVGLSQAVG